MRVITNEKRDNRSFHKLQVMAGLLSLVAVGPNILSSYCGRVGYFFCAQLSNGDLCLLSNKPCESTKQVHERASGHFGVKAKVVNTNTSGLKVAKLKKEKKERLQEAA